MIRAAEHHIVMEAIEKSPIERLFDEVDKVIYHGDNVVRMRELVEEARREYALMKLAQEDELE